MDLPAGAFALPSLASSPLVPWARAALPPRRTAVQQQSDTLESLGQFSVTTENSLPPISVDEVLGDYIESGLADIARHYKVLGCSLVSFSNEARPHFIASAGTLSSETLQALTDSAAEGDGLFYRRIHRQAPLIAKDLLSAKSLALDPLVAGSAGLRFYVGVPIFNADDELEAMLSIYDDEPKPDFRTKSLKRLQKAAKKITLALSTSRS